MSNFKDTSTSFTIHDDYYTPKYAWAQIKHFIERKGFTTIYEAFMLNSNEQSKKYLQELGFNVVGDKTIDFLTDEIDKNSYDIVVSNPPFVRVIWSKRKTNLKYMCIKKLLDNDKPFIIILNSMNIMSKWFKELIDLSKKNIEFIYPTKKMYFDKYEKGGLNHIETKKGTSFLSCYMTYGILDKNEWI